MSCPQVPERFGELGPRILESVPCGPFLYPGASLPCSAPTYFLHIFMHGATDGPLLMDNLEPPPTHRVPAPLLGSCPPSLSSLLSTVTSPVRAAHTGSQLERPPLFFLREWWQKGVWLHSCRRMVAGCHCGVVHQAEEGPTWSPKRGAASGWLCLESRADPFLTLISLPPPCPAPSDHKRRCVCWKRGTRQR